MKVIANKNTRQIYSLVEDTGEVKIDLLQIKDYIILNIEDAVSSYIEYDEGIIPVFRELTNSELAPYLLTDINANYQKEISLITSGIQTSEISTWTKQESEARAYLLDSNASTPFIDAICLARDCDKSYLVGKIIEKADAYAIAVGTLTGIRQKLEKEILGE